MRQTSLKQHWVHAELRVEQRHVAVHLDEEVDALVALVEMRVVVWKGLRAAGAAEGPTGGYLETKSDREKERERVCQPLNPWCIIWIYSSSTLKKFASRMKNLSRQKFSQPMFECCQFSGSEAWSNAIYFLFYLSYLDESRNIVSRRLGLHIKNLAQIHYSRGLFLAANCCHATHSIKAVLNSPLKHPWILTPH